MRLTAIEARVVGSLLEKELATPQQYPLTINALVAACNQTSNREPVVHYDEATVEDALATLREQRLVRFVHPSHGRSVLRYRLVLDEVLGVDERQRALLGVLLLRGPQTLGELRIRTERLASFEGLEDVERVLASLSSLEEPLVQRIDRRPGQKEDRYSQLMVPEHERAGRAEHAAAIPYASDQDRLAVANSTAGAGGEPPLEAARGPAGTDLDELRSQVAEIATAVGELRRELDELRKSLGG